MIELLEHRRLLSASPTPVLTTTTTTVHVPVGTILPSGQTIIAPADATVTTTDSILITTNSAGQVVTTKLETITSVLNYTSDNNVFSAVGISTELTVVTAGSLAQVDASYTQAVFNENGSMYLTIKQSKLFIESASGATVANYSSISVTGPDAAAAIAANPTL